MVVVAVLVRKAQRRRAGRDALTKADVTDDNASCGASRYILARAFPKLNALSM